MSGNFTYGVLAAGGVLLAAGGFWLYRRYRAKLHAKRTPQVYPPAPAAPAEIAAAEPGTEGLEAHAAVKPALPLDFLALTFALSLPFYLFGERPVPLPVQLPVSALAAFTPMIAAALLTYRKAGRQGVNKLFKRALDVKGMQGKAWLLPALLLNLLIAALAYLVMRLVGLPLPEPQIPWVTIPVFLAVFFLFAIGEELGWQGYAFEPLQSRFGVLGAGLFLGVVWGLFHLIPDLQNQRSADWILWQRLGGVALRVLIAWLYTRSGKNLFAAELFHATSNLAWILFPNFGSHYDPLVTGLLNWVAAAVLLFGMGPRGMGRRRFARTKGSVA